MDRNIFEYDNGEARVFGDPLAIDRAIRSRLIDVAAIVRKVNSIDLNAKDPAALMEGFAAQEAMAEALREAFTLTPFDPATGKGATEEHCFAVWSQFVAFLESKKKQPESSPTSGPSTVSPPATNSTTESTSA